MVQAGGLLDSISEFCRRAGMAESTFGRRAVNDGKFVSRLRDGARITPETLERVSAFLSSRGIEAPASPRELMPLLRVAGLPRLDVRPAQCRGRSLAQFPLLRQSPEVSAVRQHLRREGDGSAARGPGTGPPPSRAAGHPPVRRRHGRRHRAHPRHARDAPPLTRRCPSTSSARRSAWRTRGSASTRWPTASTSIPRPCSSSPTCTTPRRRGWRPRRSLPQPRWCGTRWRCRVPRRRNSASRSRRSSRSSPGSGRRDIPPRPATPSTSARSPSSSTVTITASCSMTSFRGRARRVPITIWSSPRSLTARACPSSSRPPR